MNCRLYTLFFLIFSLFIVEVISAGESEGFSFTRIDINQGLSHNLVQCIFKDSRGFIWFGTNSGLNRYDGYSFKIFRHIPSDPTSIIDNRIRGIFEDSSGKLWISLVDTFVIFNPENEKFSADNPIFHKNIEVPSARLARILQDEAGNIWFVSRNDGIFLYVVSGDSIVHLFHNENDTASIQAGGISSVAVDRENNFWIAGFYGLLEKIDGKTYEVIYRSDYLKDKVNGQTSLQIYPDMDDDLWIYSSSSADGIYLFEKKSKGYKHFYTGSSQYRINNNIVNDIMQDDKGILWIGTDHGGIDLIDKKDNSLHIIQNNPDDSRSLSQNSIISLYKDDEGIIWVGTFKKGVCYYHDNLYKFKLYKHQPNNPNSLPFDDVNCFQEDEKGNLWLGTNGEGLCYFDRTNNRFSQFKHDPKNSGSLSNDVIVSMCYDKQRILWLGTYYGGLNRYDGKTFQHFRNNPSDPGSIANDRVWEIFEDSEANLWIGTLGSGLDLYDRNTKIFRHYQAGEANSVNSGFILHITEDTEKNLWIGTANGVDKYNLKKKLFKHYVHDPADSTSLSNDVVFSIAADSRGLIWVATQEGLNIFNKRTGHFKRLYDVDGLPGNTILSVIEDRMGNIWISTTNGISNIKVTRNRTSGEYDLDYINYSEADGLQGKEFNEGTSFRTSRGELIFGGPDGFNLINPEQIVFNNKPPVIVFTGFQIFNRNIEINQKINGRVILQKAINKVQEVRLKHFEDVISIEFAALNYIHPEKNKYEYILEGFNKEWMRVSGQERKATYTNLDPGEYTFRVRASNNDGVWNKKGISLKIVVRPPIWKTKGALFLYIVLLVTALVVLRRIILLNERIKFRNEQEKQEARRRHELDLLKIRFFTNVSHEFRTPLSLIITPLEKMLKKTNDDHQRSQLKLIYRNSKRLLNLVNQLLDFRRMEVQKISLKPSYGDVVRFVEEIYQTFTDLAEKKSIRFEYNASEKEFYTFFDHDKLEKIIFNLVSNAFKFTPEGMSVSINLSIESADPVKNDTDQTKKIYQRQIIISVKDTGIGIAADKLDKIFDRFFQDDLPGSFVNQGSGIGLALTKEFIRLYDGTIDVESEPGKGSTFVVKLPVYTDPIGAETMSFDLSDKLEGIPEEIEHLHANIHSDQKNSLILLVEDNDDFRFYLKDNLKSKYSIIEAADGKEGIAKAIASLPDLIVSDVMMPEIDGFELCRQLKSNISTSHIPIILLTARMADNKRIEGYETGADDYITKPFNFEILESRMYNLISQRERIKNSFQKHFKIEPGEIGITSLDEKLINKALKLVEQNISDAEFSVEKLSRELGMSRVHLYKKLTALTGKTPIEFIRIMRLKRAAQFLEKSQLTVAEIAYEVGFNDPRYFSRYFKTEFGVLPSMYVKEKKEIH
jgi:signal transduction histidine kinase/ligand-binding sensor domain-containing protein/DNA-binding response OmpR family regulator